MTPKELSDMNESAGIQELVRRAGFDWDRIPDIFQDDLTNDHHNHPEQLSDSEAVRRIRPLLYSIAPEAAVPDPGT